MRLTKAMVKEQVRLAALELKREERLARRKRRLKQKQKHSEAVGVVKVRRGGWLKIGPHIWGKTHAPDSGSVSCLLPINGWDVFAVRVTRGDEHNYYFTMINAVTTVRTSVRCPREWREARAFNESVRQIIGITFKA